ncbi:hypothetical protein EYC84_008639 [Monilinia fructicola]|uniref:Uncharacterized protein n=1 Tax=Monilinia fructicola TaxID=38448 RepID=A0A5M9JHY0_MONFR|nr:hypothetical protein EYC84_008639 [Monilinia fructicola]
MRFGGGTGDGWVGTGREPGGCAVGGGVCEGIWGVLGGRALTNLQTFTGSLGGVTADPITNSGDHSRPYMVSGDTFPAYTDAVSRSCANQNNKCADVANDPSKASEDLSVGACQTQSSSCIAAGATATQTNFQVLTSSNAEFDFICDS